MKRKTPSTLTLQDMIKKSVLIALMVFMAGSIRAEDGYRLWLRYDQIGDAAKLKQYREYVKGYWLTHSSPTMEAIRFELAMALPGLLGSNVSEVSSANDNGVLRSEEHTSELQSRENLVCRLLLEKKKRTGG